MFGFAAAEGHDDEHSHEKKSVLKKVKAKAKKIKDTLKKHGHDHEHHPDERYNPDDHDLDEEDDEDEEMVEDPEVHDGTGLFLVHTAYLVRCNKFTNLYLSVVSC